LSIPYPYPTIMQVKFTQSIELSYNGNDTKRYESGQVYSTNHPQEIRAFEIALETGYAKMYDPSIDDRPTPQETKVAKPKMSKSEL
jgi:hypothetical protein